MQLQWGRDSLVAEMLIQLAANRVRIHDASMGPRLVSRGNTDADMPNDTQESDVLQWGRGSLVAEI